MVTIAALPFIKPARTTKRADPTSVYFFFPLTQPHRIHLRYSPLNPSSPRLARPIATPILHLPRRKRGFMRSEPIGIL